MSRSTCLGKLIGFASNDVWAIGCQIHHYDGHAWRRADLDPATKHAIAGGGAASWGSSPRDIYGVTGWGERLTDPSTYRDHVVQRTYDHWDGKRWTERRWPVWPCNQPRGKVDPQPLQVRPLTGP